MSGLTIGVLLAPLAFLAVAFLATRHPGVAPWPVRGAGLAAGVVGIAVAVVAGLVVALDGPVRTPTLGAGGLGLSIRLDALSTVMLGMITVLALVIFHYSSTYLDGDPRHGSFLGRLAGTVAAVEVLVLAGNLVLIVLAWVATSLALHRLLLFYPDRRRAVLAARKKFAAARVGDLLLVIAAVALYVRYDTGDLGALAAAIGADGVVGWQLGATQLAAVCIAVAALLKSAQFPTHGWLVEVMETPTPVSALLHAGILNAGPFLVIRLAHVTDGAALANVVLIVVGGLTAAFASVSLLTQPSVKVALGYSSAAHMGFMLLVCGLGVYPAALLHLVAHSFYKAHAFLASGSVIDEAKASGVRIPSRLGSPARIGASLAAALGLYAAFSLVWGTQYVREATLLLLGLILVLGVTQLLAPTLDSAAGPGGVAVTAGLALAVVLAFFTLESGAHELLDHTLPESASRGLVELVVAAGVVAAFAGVVGTQIVDPTRASTGRRRALAVHFRNGFYANALLDRAVGALRTPGDARAAR